MAVQPGGPEFNLVPLILRGALWTSFLQKDAPSMIKKGAALGLGLLLLASPLILTLPWNDWMRYGHRLRWLVTELGPWAGMLLALSTALGTALGLPRLIFCVMGGWLLGFEAGFGWSHMGSLAGAYALFLIARHTRPETLIHKYPKLAALSRPAGKGWFSVLVVRQLPLAGLYNDILLAWSPVSHRDFWIGSFIGFLPLGITASLVGAGAIQTNLQEAGRYLGYATVAFLILTFGTKWLVRRLSAGGLRSGTDSP